MILCVPLAHQVVTQQVVLGRRRRWRRLPGDGWRDGTWLGCVRPSVPPPLESGAVAPSAAKGKRRVDFCAPVPASKRVWVVTGIGAGWLRELARGEREAREAGAVAAAKAGAAAAEEAAAAAAEVAAAEKEAVVAAAAAAAAVAAAPKRKVSFGAEMSPAKVVVGWQGGGDDCSEAEEEESICSEEESGSEAAEDEWWAQGGGGGRGGGSCFGGDFGYDAATLARAAQWRRENPDLAGRAEFFHSLWGQQPANPWLTLTLTRQAGRQTDS